MARRLGANVFGDLLDPQRHWTYPVVIDAAREPELLAEAVRCLAAGGHMSNAAMFFQDTPLPLWEMYKRDVTFSMGSVSVM